MQKHNLNCLQYYVTFWNLMVVLRSYAVPTAFMLTEMRSFLDLAPFIGIDLCFRDLNTGG